MKQFIVKYRSPHHSEPYELIFASDKAHAIGIGQERYGSKLVCVEYAGLQEVRRNELEDTLWLLDLQLEVLHESMIWPTWVRKITRVAGPLLTTLALFEATNGPWWSAVSLALVAGYCARKHAECTAVLHFVRNELKRREHDSQS